MFDNCGTKTPPRLLFVVTDKTEPKDSGKVKSEEMPTFALGEESVIKPRNNLACLCWTLIIKHEYLPLVLTPFVVSHI